MDRILVFCGSNPGSNPIYVKQAGWLGLCMAKREIGLVYGGGSRGMMGAIADAVLAGGGDVIGVVPKGLFGDEHLHNQIPDVRWVASMHERKAMMAELADGIIAMPGGIGTMEELFEAWTWAQLGIHDTPVGVFNVAGYFDQLLVFAEHMADQQFLKSPHHALLTVSDDAEDLIERLLDRVSRQPP